MRRPLPPGWRVLRGEGLGLFAEAPPPKVLRLEDLSPQQLAAHDANVLFGVASGEIPASAAHETLLRCARSLAAIATQTPPSGPAVASSEPGSPVA